MKGLILKDIYGLKAYGKTALILFLVYFVTAMFAKSSTAISAFIGAFCMVIPISSFNYDKYYKWDEFAASLPLGRSKIVLAKYVFTLLIVILAIALITIINLVCAIASPDGFSMSATLESLFSTLIIMSVYILMPSIILPIMLKFGPEKGKIIIFIAIGAFSAGGVAFASFLTDSADMAATNLFSGSLATFACLVPLASMLILAISYFIAVALYKSRDL